MATPRAIAQEPRPVRTDRDYRPPGWQPVPPRREDRGPIKVVWLSGTPYEMGYQHGELLEPEIASLGRETFATLGLLGRGLGLSRLAARRSFPAVLEECQGMTDAIGESTGMTLDACLVLAFGDVYQEFFGYVLPQVLFNDGCSNFAVAGPATASGRLYHGRSLENNGRPIDYWVDNTTVFVRQPNQGIPHAVISVPGMVWPNSGLNVAGLSVSLNTAHPREFEQLSLYGGSNVQMMSQILQYADTFELARDFLKAQDRMRANLIIVTDGRSRRAGVFELTGREEAVRELDDNGVVVMTNHFVSPEMEEKDSRPRSASSLVRLERFQQLLYPSGIDSRYGEMDPTAIVEVLRDRVNPRTFQESPADIFDDDASIATNGALRQAVFDPEQGLFWIASGSVPTPANPFRCFSLKELLGFPDAPTCPAPAIE